MLFGVHIHVCVRDGLQWRCCGNNDRVSPGCTSRQVPKPGGKHTPTPESLHAAKQAAATAAANEGLYAAAGVCDFRSRNGVCKAPPSGKDGSLRCARHTCTHAGCSNEKPSKDSCCPVHTVGGSGGGGGGAAAPAAAPAAASGEGGAVGNRFLDLLDEDGEQRAPIASLFPDTLPIPASLEASLAAVAPQIATCAKLIKMASKKARKVAKTLPHIPQHMLAAIVLYTMEDVADREKSVYYILNKALRAKVRANVKPWRDYIWLLLNALKLLPAASSVMVFRGMKVGAETLGDDYANDEEFVWSGFSSTATTVDVMQTFMGTEGPRTLFTLELTESVGRDLRDFSLFPSENEILLPPNMQFEVVSRFDAGNGLTMVQCKQVEADDAILSLSA